MRISTSKAWIAGLALAGVVARIVAAAEPAAVPFKLGTFRAADREYLGLVIKDATVVDIAEANADWERRNANAPKVRIPVDMKELIARYDGELAPRLRELARAASTGTPAFARAVSDVKSLPPVRPSLILNAGASR
jgi:hypothetical protein